MCEELKCEGGYSSRSSRHNNRLLYLLLLNVILNVSLNTNLRVTYWHNDNVFLCLRA